MARGETAISGLLESEDVLNTAGAMRALGAAITREVSQDGGGGSDYTAKLKSAGFVGDKFAAAYEPPDGQSEVNLKGTFSPNGADGDWSVGAKDQPANPAVATGTWKIAKK